MRRRAHIDTATSARTRSTTTTSSPRPREYDNVILAYRNGAPVRVRDIGQRDRRAGEHAISAAWQNGKQGILLLVFKQPGANVIDTVERIKARAAAAGGVDPAVGPCRRRSCDRTQTIRASVEDVQFTLMLSIAWW